MFKRVGEARKICNKNCTRLSNKEKWFTCFLRLAERETIAAVEGGGFGECSEVVGHVEQSVETVS